MKGIEPDGRNVSMINKKLREKEKLLNLQLKNFQQMKFYDVIWMSHVLEHLLEPMNFLKKLKII